MLKLSSDRKVTSKAKLSSGRWSPEIPNAFGLPAHISCPGKTEVCQNICYAFSLERAYTNVSKLLKHNWDELQDCTVTQMTELIVEMLETYVAKHEKVEKLRKETYPKIFRIHWDGDFFSVNYAKAWAKAMTLFPDVQFWAYTRSFSAPVNVVPALVGVENLSLYLSTDTANMAAAKKIIAKYPSVKVAALDQSFASASDVIKAVKDKGAPKCPEQTGRYDLVTEHGKGACAECNLCVAGTNDVLFSISKK